MQIGELAKSAGVTVQTIRFYERKGLLPSPPRKESGYRIYDEADLRRLQFVRQVKRLGFSLDENSRFLVLTVYAVRMSALAIGEVVKQIFADLGGTVEVGEMAVREEARGLLLPTAIFARWSRS